MVKRRVAAAVVAGALSLWPFMQGHALAVPALTQISSDPYTNSYSQHQTEVEPDTLSSGSTTVSAFQVGRVFDGGASNIGFATSTDNGSTWTQGYLPGTTVNATPAGTYRSTSDASVAYDAKHGVWLISYLGLVAPTGPVDVLVSRSTDGGLNWSKPVTVAAASQSFDKNWSVCDNTVSSPFYGHCYTEFDDNSIRDALFMSTSTDGGKNWSTPIQPNGAPSGIGGQPLVQPDGTIVVPVVGFTASHFQLSNFSSSNGGVSWSAPSTISPMQEHGVAGNLRSDLPFPTAETDATGTIYVVWPDCRFEPKCSANDLVMSTSKNGNGWSPVTRVPTNQVGSGADHFIAGLAVDRSTSGSAAHLALTYYYYPDANCDATTCQLDVGYLSSTNAGTSWSSAQQLAGPMAMSWLPNTTQGFMVGDYISTSIDANGMAHPVIAVATAPSGGAFNEYMATPSSGLAVAGGTVTDTHSSTSNGSSISTGSTITSH